MNTLTFRKNFALYLLNYYMPLYMRAVRKVFIHFEYLENRSLSLDVTWQLVRRDLPVHP